MKRFLSISMLMIYLTFSVGFVISMHYCGGSLASLNLFAEASCCCDDDTMNQKDDCCKNEFKTLKISDEQNIQKEIAYKFSNDFEAALLPVPAFYTLSSVGFINKKIDNQRLPRPPNRASVIPAYKLNNSFLFYS